MASITLPGDEFPKLKFKWLGDRAIIGGKRAADASDTKGPQFESNHRQNFILPLYFIEEKDVGNVLFFKKRLGKKLD